MAKLTITDAARVAGVARSTLHRAINTGRISVDPDGRLDTVELLRAGYMLQLHTQQEHATPLHDATPRNSSAQQWPFPPEIQSLQAIQQERDLLRLERDLLRQQLDAAQQREQAALGREREVREERLAAREREAHLLRLVEQMQHRYDRLLDQPRTPAPVSPQDTLGATQALPSSLGTAPQPPDTPQRQPGASTGDPRGEMRRRIVALLRDHPEGLTPAEIRVLLGVERSLADTCLGMMRYGLVQRVGRGRYIARAPARHD